MGFDESQLRRDLSEIAGNDKQTLNEYATSLGINGPELESSSDLIDLIVQRYRDSDGQPSSQKNVDVGDLRKPGTQYVEEAIGERENKKGGRGPRKVDWWGKYRQPFKPNTDGSEIWQLLKRLMGKSGGNGIPIQSLENCIRSELFRKRGRYSGLYTGTLLYNVIRTACMRGWEIRVEDKTNPLTMGKIVGMEYVGRKTQPPSKGVEVL